MHAKRMYGLLLIALALPGMAIAAESAKLRQIVPPDAFFYIGVDDITQLRTTWAKTSLARFWKDPAVRQFTAPLRAEIDKSWREFKENENISDDWLSYLPGEVVFFSEHIKTEGEIYEMPMCFAAKTGLPRERYLALINKYIEKLPPDARKRQYTAQGITVRMVSYTEELDPPEMPATPMPGAPPPVAVAPKKVPGYFQYAFADDVILLCDSDEQVMRRMIRRLKAPPGKSVADVSALKRVRGLLPADSQVTGYFAADQFFGLMLEQMKNAAAGQPQMFNPAGLGLDKFQGVGLGIHMAEKRFTVSMAVDVPQEGPGLVAVVRKLRTSPLASLAVTPASVLSYSSMAADWAGLWNELRTTIRTVAPSIDFPLTMTVQVWESNLGMKIPELLGAFGEEFSYFLSVPPGPVKQPRLTALIAVKDQARLKQAIELVTSQLQGRAQIDATEFLGHTIHAVRPTAPPGMEEMPAGERPQVCWALTGDLLAISSSLDSVKHVLQLKAGKRKDSLATSETYREARALLPKKLDAFEVVQTGGFLELLLEGLLAFGRQPNGPPGLDEAFDFSAPLSADIVRRYFGLITTGSQFDSSGIASVTVMEAPKE